MAKKKTIRRITEENSQQRIHDKHVTTELKETYELILHFELEILLSERKGITKAVDYRQGEKARYMGEFLEQDRDFIAQEIKDRIILHYRKQPDMHIPSLYQIKLYLKKVSEVIRAKLAYADNEGYNAFTGEDTNGGNGFSAIPYINKAFFMPKQRGQRGKSKKNKERKQGRKRPVMGYPSMAAAQQATGLGYEYIRYQAQKEDENKL